MAKRLLGIFAKYWEPGRVKTRLAARIGPDKASTVYRAFVETLVFRFGNLADGRVIAFTPAEREREFAEIAGNAWQIQPQVSGDLGRRMAAFFDMASARGFHQCVLIGSDSPTLPREYVDQAFRQLQDHKVVLGPSHDGGYYLVGASGGSPEIFTGIEWSTENVWDQTVRRLKSGNTPFAVLPSWYDVDDYEDLCRLRDELESGGGDGPQADRLRLAVQAALCDLANDDLRT